jgi:NADH-quinone oxidoreductase subunit J
MGLTFPLIATVTWGAALAAMTLRRPVHSALALVVAFLGLAVTYLTLDAQFLGVVQVLVYVGAVIILIVFVIQLTRNVGLPSESLAVRPAVVGVGTAALVTGGLISCLVASPRFHIERSGEGTAPVKELGEALMANYVVALEGIGLLLTVALIGGVLIATRRPAKKGS